MATEQMPGNPGQGRENNNAGSEAPQQNAGFDNPQTGQSWNNYQTKELSARESGESAEEAAEVFEKEEGDA